MSENLLLFVGSLNREAPYFQGARGDGLSVWSFDETRLAFARIAHYPAIENPTYLSVSSDGRRIYANSEVADWKEGLVTAFAFSPEDGRLDYLNMQPTLGSIAAHNMLSRDGRHLFLANYTVGSGGPDQSFVVFQLEEDGSLAPPQASVAHQGHGPVETRQERSHAHSATEAMKDGIVIVADLGMDALVSYRIADDGNLRHLATSHTLPGAGPRHLALDPEGRFVFVINELDSTVTSWLLDSSTGALQPIDRQPAAPDGASNHCSDIQISADGRFLYCGNRGHDSILILEIVLGTGRLIPLGHVPCGGQTPRNLALTPSGRHLLVANQNSDRVTVLARNPETGRLRETGAALQIGTPMCLKLAAIG